MRHRHVNLLVALAAILAVLAVTKCPAGAQTVRLEVQNIMPGGTVQEVLAWTHATLAEDLHARGRPEQPLADLSRSLPAGPFAELVRARPATVELVQFAVPLRPGETARLAVPTRANYHRGLSVVMPLQGEHGYLYARMDLPRISAAPTSALAHAWEARSHVHLHRARPGPGAIVRARFSVVESSRPPPPPRKCSGRPPVGTAPNWADDLHGDCG